MQRVNNPKLIFMYLQQKCSWAIGNCRQANGDNRHLVPDMPIGLGRDIRDMPIACARTRPDANKHARHIPMYRPVHSGHPNKCSPCLCSVAGSLDDGCHWRYNTQLGGSLVYCPKHQKQPCKTIQYISQTRIKDNDLITLKTLIFTIQYIQKY